MDANVSFYPSDRRVIIIIILMFSHRSINWDRVRFERFTRVYDASIKTQFEQLANYDPTASFSRYCSTEGYSCNTRKQIGSFTATRTTTQFARAQSMTNALDRIPLR